jgi:outer membrane protein insertion porin family
MAGLMENSRARSALLVSGLACLLGSTALTSAAFAQDNPAAPAPPAAAPEAAPAPIAPQTGVVQRIIVEGAERIERNTIVSYMPIAVGDTVDPAKIDLALKTLFRTDLFADVRIDLRGTDLVVQVVENPIINQVVFEGNSALKEDKLRDEVSVRPRGIFTRARIQQDVQRIIELYRRSGRISASVTPKIVELPQKRVDLVFEINEGPKSGILFVNFIGNRKFSDNDLREVVVTKESRWYKFFSSNDNYDPDRLEYDREQLRKFYRNRGFYDFRIVSAVAELAPDKNGFAVTYTVDEGPEYRFGKVTVQTELARLKAEQLQQLLPIREGQVYQDTAIEQATDALTFAAGAAGFAFVDVRPRYTPNRENGTVDVTFDVKEGPRVYIERIDVIGNTRTLDPVVRRELLVAEGDAYNRVLVDRSTNQVKALGFFKGVDIEQLPGSAPDKTILRVKVEEQPTGELSFSVGYSSVDQVVADIGITERNFRGRGQNLRFRISAGSLRQQVDFSFTEPRFLGRNLSAGLDLYSYRYDFSDYASYDTRSTGASLRFGFPLTQNASMLTRYSIHADEIVVDDSACVPGLETVSRSLCQQRGDSLTSLLGYTVRWDRRNDPINPTRGFTVNLSQDLAGVGGDVKYVRNEGDVAVYYGFTPAFILSVSGSAGYIAAWDDDYVRLNDRFYKGGNSFRGFESAGLGPRDIRFDDSLGGNAYAIGSVELTVPTGLPEQYGIKAALFSDFGSVGILDDQSKIDPATGRTDPNIRDDFSLRASAGISIFWKSPMGPLRFDFSQVLAKENYDKTETFKFSTSTRF